MKLSATVKQQLGSALAYKLCTKLARGGTVRISHLIAYQIMDGTFIVQDTRDTDNTALVWHVGSAHMALHVMATWLRR